MVISTIDPKILLKRMPYLEIVYLCDIVANMTTNLATYYNYPYVNYLT